MATHYVEDPSIGTTRCGLTSLEYEDDNLSLSLDECTCVQCLSLVIFDLSQRIQNINKKDMLKFKGCSTVASNPVYAVKSHSARINSDVVSTPIYAAKSPKSRNNGRDL